MLKPLRQFDKNMVPMIYVCNQWLLGACTCNTVIIYITWAPVYNLYNLGTSIQYHVNEPRTDLVGKF